MGAKSVETGRRHQMEVYDRLVEHSGGTYSVEKEITVNMQGMDFRHDMVLKGWPDADGILRRIVIETVYSQSKRTLSADYQPGGLEQSKLFKYSYYPQWGDADFYIVVPGGKGYLSPEYKELAKKLMNAVYAVAKPEFNMEKRFLVLTLEELIVFLNRGDLSVVKDKYIVNNLSPFC